MVGIMVASLSATSQHAVIVAREYRIPTVLMTRDATNVISDGQPIAVNGDRSIVKLDT